MPEIQWNALQTPDFFAAGQQGMQAGREQASRNALRGYANDPAGTTQQLIANGDISSAAALSQLGYQNTQRDILTQGAQSLFGRTPQAGQPQQPAQTAQATQPPQLSDSDKAGAAQRLDFIDTTAQMLATLPYEQRKGALQAAGPKLLEAGFTPEQLSGFDPTDAGLEQVREQVQQVGQQLGAPATPPAAQAGGDPQAQPDPASPPSDTATPLDLRDPSVVRGLGMMTLGNPQVGGALTTLASASMPHYESGRPGAPIIDSRTGKITGYAPNAEGIQYVSDGHNGFTAQVVPGYREAHAENEAASAQATQHGKDVAHAPFELIDVKLPDGTSAQMTLDQFKTLKASGQMPSLGKSQSPGDAEFAHVDAENFGKEIDSHGASAIIPLQTARTNTEAAIHLAQQINPNAWTPNAAHIAGMINAATGGKIGATEANNVSTYQALLQQVLRGSFTTFPRLEKEFEVVQKAAANISTPKDAALILLGSQAALADRNLAYSQFVQNWNGPKSKQAMTQAFLQSPAGQTSIFADPIWRNLTIAGKPAVMVGGKPMPDGHTYGVFRPGTPYAQTFRVQ